MGRAVQRVFDRDGVLEDRTTIEKHLAVSVMQDDLHDIEKIVNRLDKLNGDYSEFYDCADEVAGKLMSLLGEILL